MLVLFVFRDCLRVRDFNRSRRRSSELVTPERGFDPAGGHHWQLCIIPSLKKINFTLYREENLTPRMFLERYSLPRVVHIVPQEPVSVDSEEAGPMALLHGRLLMFRQYRSGKVEARSELRTKHGSDLVSLVVIPDTYQGQSVVKFIIICILKTRYVMFSAYVSIPSTLKAT